MGYEFDSNGVCQDKCGDGVIIDAQCDDNNTEPGDGCSSLCTLESGFNCNLTSSPTFCKSSVVLVY